MIRWALLYMLTVFSISLTAQHWTVSELPSMPEAVSNNAVCEGFVNGVPYVYSFGGIDETKEYSGIHNRSYRYNTQTTEWEAIEPIPDNIGKIAAAANRIGDIIYIIGGYYVFANGTEESSDLVSRYNTQTNSYLSDGAAIPIPIDDHVQAVYKDSLIYVISGWSNSGNVNDVQIYDPIADEWHEGTPITWMEEAVFGAAGTIIGDTIYFYGGAKNGDFGPSRKLRKGAINPDNPTEITWSSEVLSFSLAAYRPAATSVGNSVYFIGGADQTYNFNGLAYSNGQGVEPNNRSLSYRPEDGFFESDLSNNLPMDLRGIANENDTIKYLAGGMLSNQVVSDKLWKLEWVDMATKTTSLLKNSIPLKVFPNPVTEFLFIEFQPGFDCKEVNIQILNQNGTIVLRKGNTDCSNQLDIKSLPPGIYQIRIYSDKKIGLSYFVKI
jgi:type IX secretion system substrate protein/Kelch motif protein/galactose oxidase-like protein